MLVRNEAMWDRVVRSVVGLALLVWGLWMLTDVLQWVVGIIGLILLFTGFVGMCPIYRAFNFSTYHRSETRI